VQIDYGGVGWGVRNHGLGRSYVLDAVALDIDCSVSQIVTGSYVKNLTRRYYYARHWRICGLRVSDGSFGKKRGSRNN
jgi:hypothetical protein